MHCTEWEVVQSSPTSYTFTTNHDCAGHQPMKLVRTVRLEGRTVRSETHLVNTGGVTVPVCWYPHPFFPQSVSASSTQFHTICSCDMVSCDTVSSRTVRFIADACHHCCHLRKGMNC